MRSLVRLINCKKSTTLNFTQSFKRLLASTSKSFQSSSNVNNATNDAAKKTLSPTMQMYASKLNNMNKEDYDKKQTVKNYNKIVGLVLGVFVLGVYAYTMMAISQEKFLDDFDVPEPPDPGYKEANKNRK